MRLTVALCLVAAFVLSAGVRPQGVQMRAVGLTVFTEAEFRGVSATFRDDVPNLQQSGLNDRIVSLRVGRGEIWEVCEHARYRGRCVVMSGEEPDLSRNGWSNAISSIRRVRRSTVSTPDDSRSQGLVLFARPGFTGDRRRVDGAVPDLDELGFDDLAMSLRVGRGETWDVCAETRFRDCYTVNGDWRDLRDLPLRGRISSVRPRY
jgi:hypothetical protein